MICEVCVTDKDVFRELDQALIDKRLGICVDVLHEREDPRDPSFQEQEMN